MSEIRNVHLAFVCKEKLERNAAGEFYCNKCAHTIVDFRCQSAETLQQAIAQAGAHPVCGIFKNSQLSEKFTRYAAAAAIAATAASATMCATPDEKLVAQQSGTHETRAANSEPACSPTPTDSSLTNIPSDSFNIAADLISYKIDLDSMITFGFVTTPEHDLLTKQYSVVEALKRDIAQMESKTNSSGEAAH